VCLVKNLSVWNTVVGFAEDHKQLIILIRNESVSELRDIFDVWEMAASEVHC